MWPRRRCWRALLPPRRLQVSSLAAVALFVLMVTVGRRRNGEEDIAEYGADSRRPLLTVKRVMEQWHLSDRVIPTESAFRNAKWRGFPPEELFRWSNASSDAALKSESDYPGRLGKPVILEAHEKASAKKSRGTFQINLVASDKVPPGRELRDVRNPLCRGITYPEKLPRASVIVIFHNEAWSTLVRTVHSVINSSPRELVGEIILVDDFSENEHLKSKLDKYAADLSVPTRVIHTERREGLIRARLIGARSASSSVLIFFDAHVEVTRGWLAPLLSDMAADRTRVMLPVIDDVDEETFEYVPTENDHVRGGMDRKLMHRWIGARNVTEDQSPTSAFPSPTMIGCAFAVDKEYFFAVGGFDAAMNIWGGENVELSVRVWRCGGYLLKNPCSRVGHVYRKASPHSIPGGIADKMNTIAINTGRFAEVWTDEYKEFYYRFKSTAKNLELGDLTPRERLKERLQCHSFQWYLDNVYPDSGFPTPTNHRYLGQIQESRSGKCLDAVGRETPLAMRDCHGLGGYQTLMYSSAMEIRTATRCLSPDMSKVKDAAAQDATAIPVVFEVCDGSGPQKWSWTEEEGAIVHAATGMCLQFEESGQSGTKKKREKSLLKYLTNVAKEVISSSGEEKPSLSSCEGGGVNRWKMDTPFLWRT